MKSFCTITPTRGDRPELLDFCKHQLSRMTTKPDASFFIDHTPMTTQCDLQDRLRRGIAQAKSAGIEWCFIIEDDDWYSPGYFDAWATDFRRMFGGNSNLEFWGYQDTVYYHLPTQRFQHMNHRGRASLFCTAFKTSAMDTMNWGASGDPFQDISIWSWVKRMKKPALMSGFGMSSPLPAMGMKHGIGKCGGSGHSMITMEQGDVWYAERTHLTYLRRVVDAEAYEFYTQLIHKHGWNNQK